MLLISAVLTILADGLQIMRWMGIFVRFLLQKRFEGLGVNMGFPAYRTSFVKPALRNFIPTSSIKTALLLFILISKFSISWSANRYSVANGNWNSTSTWSATSGGSAGASVPVAGDVVYIQGNRTVTVTANAACTTLNIASGSTLTLQGVNFTVSSATNISGTFSATSSTGTKSMGAVTFTGGTFNNSSTSNTFAITNLVLSNSTINGSRTAIFNVSGSMALTTGTTNTIGNITLNIAGLTTVNGTAVFTNTGGSKNFNGGLTVSGGTVTSNVREDYSITNLTLSNATLNGSNYGRFNVSGNLSVPAGTTATVNPAQLTINGTTTINGTFTVASTSGNKTFLGLVTVNSGGNWNFTANESVVMRGGLTNNGTFTAGTGTYTFNTNASQTITGTISIPNLVINTPTNLTNNGTLTVSTGLSGTGRLTQASNSTLRIADAGTFSLTSLVASATGNTVEYYRTGNQTIRTSGTTTSYYNLILSGSGTKTISGLTTVSGDLTTNGTIIATTAANLSIGGNLSVGEGTTFTIAGYNLTVNGSTTISGIHPHSSATGTKTYNGDVTINPGGSWTNTGNEGFTFNGSLQNNGTLSAGTGVYLFAGTTKLLSGTSGITIPNTTVNGNYTNNTILTVNTALSGTGSLTQAANVTLNIGGTSAISTLNATATGNTVNYTGAAQTVKNIDYFHLGLSGSGVKTMPGSGITIAGNFNNSGTATATSGAGYTFGGNITLGSGTTFNAGNFSHSITGNWSNNGATFNPSTGTISFTGSSSQTIGGTSNTTFNCFTVNNTAGVVLGRAANAACVTLSNGLLSTSSTNLLTVSGTAAGAISGSATSYVNGPLARTLPANLSNGIYSFPIGKSGYKSFDLVNASTNSAGTVVIRAEVFDSNSGGTPGVGMSSLNTDRYWNASTSGPGSITSTQVRLTENGLDDEDAIGQSATQTGAYNRISDAAPSGGTITSNAINSLGYFAIGKKPVVTIATTSNGTEGSSNGLFTLTTSKNFTVSRDINISITGTATNGTDYTTIISPVSFPAGQSSVQIPVQVINDVVVEPTETIIITIEEGTGYAIGASSSATMNILDNDAAEITVSPTSGLTTTETGGQATFSVVLTSQPTANVSVGFSTSDLTEGTVSPSSLTFTSANWNTAQTVTITGVNDFVDDGDIAYTIVTAPASSSDINFSGYNAPDVSVTNTDNDEADFTINPLSGLTTTEAGGTATFTIVLNSEPTANVSVNLSSSNTSEGTVSPATVTFTTGNWNTAQTVTITGVNDFIVDGNTVYNIVTSAALSTDLKYNVINPPDVEVTNTDNDVAEITVHPTSGLNTTEAGGTASFTIVLTSQPTANVFITLSSDDTSEGTVSPTSVTFTSIDWDTPKNITVTGVDGPMADGEITYHIVTNPATSTDPNYNGFNPEDVTVVNLDNDVAGISINPVAGLVTTEGGGTATFTIVLNTQPTSDVTIGLSSSNTNEGNVSPSSVTFTDANWNIARTITVTGTDDFIDDGNIAYTIVTANATSNDAAYNGMTSPDVSVTNNDNDVAGISVTPTSGLTTSEAGGTATFSIVLDSQPTADVTINLSSSDLTEGSVSPASVTFTSANWNSARTVTITGVNDAVDDGDIAYSIITTTASSADGLYNGKDAQDISVNNTDDDVAGIAVTPTSGLITTEAGGTATFTIVLNTEPTANVVIDLVSGDPTEGTVSPQTITFTSSNWSSAQTITLTGVNDYVKDGNIAFSILTTVEPGADALYNVIDPADVSGTNNDNDVAEITVTPTTGLTTTEAGGTATFNVKLDSEPTANVTIGISSGNLTEGTVSPAMLTFTPSNWSSNQTVTITGVNDFVQDGNIAYTIITAPATSSDVNYNGKDAPDVTVTNTDNDVAGITVSTISGNTTEDGGTATFSVVLNSQPAGNVTIGLSSSNTGEGTVNPNSLVFIPSEWNIAQNVTVTGIDDFVIDGSVSYTIITATAASSDPNYNNRDASDVAVTNTDNDVAGIIVDPTSGLTTGEDGSQATFTVKLASIPTANVTIGLSSSNTNEGTVSPASLVITPSNWNSENTVTITGINDDVDDDDITYTIVTSSSSSTDANYHNLTVSDVTVTNTDNDDAGILVEPTSGLVTSENLTSATFTIVLESKPTANVKINLSVDDTKEGDVSPTSVTFTPTNWNAPQTVTVTGKNDKQIDDDVVYNVVTAPASSTDPKYDGMDADDVEVTNLDNDSPGITVSPISGLITTEAGGSASFTVVLNTQPSNDVVINLSSSNTDEGTVSPASLTFTNSNWESAQTVTITGVNDAITDGDIAYTVTLNPAVSEDEDYNSFDPDDVSVTNTDLTPTITLGANPTICSGTTSANISYSATTQSPNQYSIDYDASANAAGFTDVTNAALPSSPISLTAPAGASAGTYNATLTVRNSTYTACISPVYSISVTINQKPATPTAASNSPVCVGATLNLTASTVSGASYSWTGPNGFTSTLQNPTITNVALGSAGTYSVTVTVNGCTSDAGTTPVNVSPLVHTNLIQVE